MTTNTTTHVGPAREMARRSTAALIMTAAGLGVAAFLTLGVVKDNPPNPVIPSFSSDTTVNYPNLDQLGRITSNLTVPQLSPTGR
ncbi:hypothetical protein ABIA30_004401 [Mycobacterium sp. MAA66]|uniref:hypothetical protein n=1 Tax=Mycobacterium sp. MAA66 TaxID=3156297 RepID=UPI003510E207